MNESGQFIYLDVPYEEIKRRLINDITRGIVIKKGNRTFTRKDILYSITIHINQFEVGLGMSTNNIHETQPEKEHLYSKDNYLDENLRSIQSNRFTHEKQNFNLK